MPRALRQLFLIALLLAAGSVRAQQSSIRGLISIHNSKTNTGERKFVANAAVKDAFEEAQPTVSDAKGTFELIYVGKPEGASVSFTVRKPGLEVVNISELKGVLGQAGTLYISMADPEQIATLRAQLYKVGKTEAEKQLTARIREQNEKLAKLRATLSAQDKAVTDLEAEIAGLRRDLGKVEEEARALASRYSLINLDDADSTFRRSFSLFQKGRIDEAQKLLGGVNYEKLTREALATAQAAANFQEQARRADSIRRVAFDNASNTLRLKLDLHKTRFQYDSMAVCYSYLVRVDSTNSDLWFDYAGVFRQLRRDSQCAAVLTRLLAITASDSVRAAAQTELGIIYQLQLDFRRADSCFRESQRLQQQLYQRDSSRYRAAYITTEARYGTFLLSTQRYGEAESSLQNALRLQSASLPDHFTDSTSQYYLLRGIGLLRSANNDLPEAIRYQQQALTAVRKRALANPSMYEKELVVCLSGLANLYLESGASARADSLFTDAAMRGENLYAQNEFVYKPLMASIALQKAQNAFRQNHEEEGIQALRRSLHLFEELTSREPDKFENDLDIAREQLGQYQLRHFQNDSAAATFDALIRNYQRSNRLSVVDFRAATAYAASLKGQVLSASAKYAAAAAAFDTAVNVYRKLFAESAEPYRHTLANTELWCGWLAQQLGQRERAKAGYASAHRLLEPLQQSNPRALFNLISIDLNLANVYQYGGNSAAADSLLEEARGHYRTLDALNPRTNLGTYASIVLLGVRFHSEMGDLLRSERELDELRSVLSGDNQEETLPTRVQVLFESARAKGSLNKHSVAIPLLEQAIRLQETLAARDARYLPFLGTLYNTTTLVSIYTGDLRAAATWSGKAASLNFPTGFPDSSRWGYQVERLFNRAEWYRYSDKPDSAIAALDSAIVLQRQIVAQNRAYITNFPRLVYTLAMNNERLGRFRANLERYAELDRMSEQVPDSTAASWIRVPARQGMAWNFLALGEPDSAAGLLNELRLVQERGARSQSQPMISLVQTYQSLARVASMHNDREAEIGWLDRAIAVQKTLAARFDYYLPYFVTLSLQKSGAFAQAGLLDSAVNAIDTALALLPDNGGTRQQSSLSAQLSLERGFLQSMRNKLSINPDLTRAVRIFSSLALEGGPQFERQLITARLRAAQAYMNSERRFSAYLQYKSAATELQRLSPMTHADSVQCLAALGGVYQSETFLISQQRDSALQKISALAYRLAWSDSIARLQLRWSIMERAGLHFSTDPRLSCRIIRQYVDFCERQLPPPDTSERFAQANVWSQLALNYAASLRPDSASIFNRKAMSLVDGLVPKSTAELGQQAVTLFNYAYLLNQAGDASDSAAYAVASPIYAKYRQAAPQAAPWYVQLELQFGNCLSARKSWTAAVARYRTALSENARLGASAPFSVINELQIQLGLAECLRRMGSLTEARAALHAAQTAAGQIQVMNLPEAIRNRLEAEVAAQR